MSADELVEILQDQRDDKDKSQSGVVSDKVGNEGCQLLSCLSCAESRTYKQLFAHSC